MTSKPRMTVRKDRDAKFTALALVIGAPVSQWAMWRGQTGVLGGPEVTGWTVSTKDQHAIRTIFSEGELGRLGYKRIMRDFARWYIENEPQEQEHGADQDGSQSDPDRAGFLHHV